MAETTTVKTLYEDFEPLCKWQRDQGRDTLEVYLQGFKKDQLRIQLSNLGVLAITGERPLEENKISRFRKEIRVTKDYKTNEIHARLAGGILYIVLPKKTQDQPTTTLPPPQNQENVRNESKTNLDSISNNKDTTTEDLGSGENAALLTAGKLSDFGVGLRNVVLNKVQIMSKKMGANVVVAIALVVVLGAFVMFKYGQRSHVES